MGTVARARQLRREMSLPEVLLWQQLRRKSTGLKFRKQHRVPPYFVDFFCAAAKLAIEVDGVAHDMGDRPERDVERDAFLRGKGIETLRILARDVLADPEDVAEGIAAMCCERIALRRSSPLRSNGEVAAASAADGGV